MAVSSSNVHIEAPSADLASVIDTDELVAAPPRWEKQVLELAPAWDELAPEHQWAAERLRIFLLTWDPFEWRSDRAAAFATSTSRSASAADGLGLVLYLPHWQALRLAGGEPGQLAVVLAPLLESIVAVGTAQRAAIEEGVYAAGVHSGALPRLLSQVPPAPTGGLPALTVVGDGWRPIQFDALEDLGQDLFGPADLDRSPVRFREPGEQLAGCPGCGGRAVAFPDGLQDAQDSICGPHRAEALRITTARLDAAKASNPEGWEALLAAGQRLLEPHLPDGLGPRLLAAATSSDGDVAEQAALVIEAAGLMAGLPDPQTPLGARLAPVRLWLEGLPAAMADAGLDEEAPRVGKAAAQLLSLPSADGADGADGVEVAATAGSAAGTEVTPSKPQPFRRDARVGRNQRCPCGSGRKYKFCHGA
ncbi:MAG TPA: SEC-C metal-binding domain-containing protein [Acidimicrobiales bacterium]|jgi:hypothetical protein|nr:SEC-C metal-binding domain-containing protein [Acidimicrobiales bacterium]